MFLPAHGELGVCEARVVFAEQSVKHGALFKLEFLECALPPFPSQDFVMPIVTSICIESAVSLSCAPASVCMSLLMCRPLLAAVHLVLLNVLTQSA